MPTFRPDVIQIRNSEYTWTSPIPAGLIDITECDDGSWVRLTARYEVDSSRKCFFVTRNFERKPATWLNGSYCAKYNNRSFYLVIRDGCLLERRRQTTFHRWCTSRITSTASHLPDYAHWLAITIRRELIQLGLLDAKKVLAAYGLGPNHYHAVDELLHRTHTPFAHDTAAKLNRSESRPIERHSEKDYYNWVVRQAGDSYLYGGLHLRLPRYLAKLFSRIFPDAPVLLNQMDEPLVMVGGHLFSPEYYRDYIVNRKVSGKIRLTEMYL